MGNYEDIEKMSQVIEKDMKSSKSSYYDEEEESEYDSETPIETLSERIEIKKDKIQPKMAANEESKMEILEVEDYKLA